MKRKHIMKVMDLDQTKSISEYLLPIVKELVKNHDEEKAREIAFNFAEIIPEMKLLVEKVEARTLTADELLKIMVHIPYHMDQANQLMFGRKSN